MYEAKSSLKPRLGFFSFALRTLFARNLKRLVVPGEHESLKMLTMLEPDPAGARTGPPAARFVLSNDVNAVTGFASYFEAIAPLLVVFKERLLN